METVPDPILPSPSTRTLTAQVCATDLTKLTLVVSVKSQIKLEKLLKTETAMTLALEQLHWTAVVRAMEEILGFWLTPRLMLVECVMVIIPHVLGAMEKWQVEWRLILVVSVGGTVVAASKLIPLPPMLAPELVEQKSSSEEQGCF